MIEAMRVAGQLLGELQRLTAAVTRLADLIDQRAPAYKEMSE